jgi:hypothetical protein
MRSCKSLCKKLWYTRFHSAPVFDIGRGISDPLREKSESVEQADEAASAKSASRCTFRGQSHFSRHLPVRAALMCVAIYL